MDTSARSPSPFGPPRQLSATKVRSAPVATQTSLGAALAAAHYSPGVTATLLRAYAWWSAWRQHAPVLPSDRAQLSAFFRTLAAAGAVRADLVSAATALSLVFQEAPGAAPITAGKWTSGVPINALAASDVSAVARQCQHPGTQLLVRLIFELGVRERQALELSRLSVDWKGQRVHVARKEGPRWMVLPSSVLPALAKALALPGESLARATDGTPLSTSLFRQDLANAAGRVGLSGRVTPAALRRSYGAGELRAGRDFRLILARLELPDASGVVPRMPGLGVGLRGAPNEANRPQYSPVSPPHIFFPSARAPPR